jgi:thiol-disulfide isomerase/thioredoxin
MWDRTRKNFTAIVLIATGHFRAGAGPSFAATVSQHLELDVGTSNFLKILTPPNSALCAPYRFESKCHRRRATGFWMDVFPSIFKTATMLRWTMRWAVFFSAFAAQGEIKDWQFRNGDTLALELRHAALEEAYFEDKRGRSISFPILAFEPIYQAEIVDWGRKQDARLATADDKLPTRFTQRFRDHMRLPEEGKLRSVDWTDRAEPEYYALYYSASWCGPCKRFSPELVSRYEVLKQIHGDLFEFALISNDRNRRDAVNYMIDYKMPWFGTYAHADRSPWRGMSGSGIPHLVIVTREGHQLFSSYRNGEYVGPRDPLDRFSKLLRQVNPELDFGRSVITPGVNREKLQEAFKASAKEARETQKPRPPKAVLTGFNLLKQWAEDGSPPTVIRCKLRICAHGTVDSIDTEPALLPEYAERLRLQSLLWQFLPAFDEDGQRVAQAVAFDLKLPLPAGALRNESVARK